MFTDFESHLDVLEGMLHIAMLWCICLFVYSNFYVVIDVVVKVVNFTRKKVLTYRLFSVRFRHLMWRFPVSFRSKMESSETELLMLFALWREIALFMAKAFLIIVTRFIWLFMEHFNTISWRIDGSKTVHYGGRGNAKSFWCNSSCWPYSLQMANWQIFQICRSFQASSQPKHSFDRLWYDILSYLKTDIFMNLGLSKHNFHFLPKEMLW